MAQQAHLRRSLKQLGPSKSVKNLFDSLESTADSSDDDLMEAPTTQCVGIYGRWLDVSNFKRVHPGGEDIIEGFLGKDATVEFTMFHETSWIDQHKDLLKVVGTYRSERHPIDDDLLQLHRQCKAKGYYKPSTKWFTQQLLWCALYLTISLTILFKTGHYTYAEHGYRYLLKFVSGVFFAAHLKCAGYLAHDVCHDLCFTQPWLNQVWRYIVASVLFGVSADAWRRDHYEHHVFTNTVTKDGPSDPQMHEGIWAQDEKIVPWFVKSVGNSKWAAWFLSIQHIYWAFLCVVAGRVPIIFNHIIKDVANYRRTGDVSNIISLGCVIIHVAITVYLLSFFNFFLESAIWFEIAATLQALSLTFELLVNHYMKPFYDKFEGMKMPWLQRQASQVTDISAPVWFEWYFGPLGHHLVHHTMPRLQRQHLPTVHPLLDALCQKHDIAVDRNDFITCVSRTFAHMKRIGTQSISAKRVSAKAQAQIYPQPMRQSPASVQKLKGGA